MMCMMTNKEWIPLTCLTTHMVFEEDGVRRLVRFLAQDHVCFFRHIIAFLCITFFTRGNEIRPRIHSAACAWHDVIDRQFFARATILTFMIVAFEYILPGKINALVRGVDISVQADHRWHRVAVSDGMQLMAIGGANHFALVEENEYEGALDGADHQGTVVLIQHQYTAIHECKIVASSLRSKKLRHGFRFQVSRFHVESSRWEQAES
jgi:hypothetical protein